jgi:hypothetical protein
MILRERTITSPIARQSKISKIEWRIITAIIIRRHLSRSRIHSAQTFRESNFHSNCVCLFLLPSSNSIQMSATTKFIHSTLFLLLPRFHSISMPEAEINKSHKLRKKRSSSRYGDNLRFISNVDSFFVCVSPVSRKDDRLLLLLPFRSFLLCNRTIKFHNGIFRQLLFGVCCGDERERERNSLLEYKVSRNKFMLLATTAASAAAAASTRLISKM